MDKPGLVATLEEPGSGGRHTGWMDAHVLVEGGYPVVAVRCGETEVGPGWTPARWESRIVEVAAYATALAHALAANGTVPRQLAVYAVGHPSRTGQAAFVELRVSGEISGLDEAALAETATQVLLDRKARGSAWLESQTRVAARIVGEATQPDQLPPWWGVGTAPAAPRGGTKWGPRIVGAWAAQGPRRFFTGWLPMRSAQMAAWLAAGAASTARVPAVALRNAARWIAAVAAWAAAWLANVSTWFTTRLTSIARWPAAYLASVGRWLAARPASVGAWLAARRASIAARWTGLIAWWSGRLAWWLAWPSRVKARLAFPALGGPGASGGRARALPMRRMVLGSALVLAVLGVALVLRLAGGVPNELGSQLNAALRPAPGQREAPVAALAQSTDAPSLATAQPTQLAQATPQPTLSALIAGAQATPAPVGVQPTSVPALPISTPAPLAGPTLALAEASVAPASTVAPASEAPVAPGSPTLASASPTPARAPVLDFSAQAGRRPAWPDDSLSTGWFAADGYHLATRQAHQFVALGLLAGTRLRDVLVTATFRKTGGPPGGGFGLIVRDQGPGPRDGSNQGGRFYVLEVGDRGEVGIWRRDGDQWVDLLVWTPSPLVRPENAENSLSVTARGAQLTLSVNGSDVATRSDTALADGEVGVFLGGDGNQAVLSRLAVQALD